jgi:two-component system sensor histidine kinase HydH
MKPPPTEEKAKPFRLVKFFTGISLILIFAGTIVLSMFNTHWTRAMQLQKSEDYALLILENLNHQVFLQFVLPVALQYGEIQLRNRDQYERLDKVVRNTLHSFKVEQVNIYDINNVIAYSFNQDLIGKKNLGGTGFLKASAGDTVSRQVQSGSFLEILLGIPKESRLLTFAPLRAERALSRMSGPVLGVVEIVQDLSRDYKSIFRFQIMVVLTSTLVMLVLFLMLTFVVKRGENIIERRAQERLKLKEQLNQAERLSSIGEMAAAISHEIRNPLGIIRSSAELLKKKVAGIDPSNTIPDIIVEEATRLNRIITEFLNFAKPRNPSLIPCRVDEVIEKNLTFLAPQLAEQHCTVDKSVEDPLPEIRADSGMLYQAFLNIIINALQAMPDGGRLHIAIGTEDGAVAIRFDDEGGGIPADRLDKIWEPFFTTKDKGSGLGLKIVKNIVELHRGAIQIANRPEGGARVLVRLPLEQGGIDGDHPDR